MISILLILLLFISTDCKHIMKPHFIPYCATRETCRSPCTCEFSPNCSLVEMNDATRSDILAYHNQIRQIQSQGEPMPGGLVMLKYDMELEELSKCWAVRCEDKYSECFTTPSYRETSQSVGSFKLSKGDKKDVMLWMKMINSWLGQANVMTIEFLRSYPIGEHGEILHNYAQIVTDRVYSVGCAWSESQSLLNFVCTYGPRGPHAGQPIYRTGKPCTLCPPGYHCEFTKPYENLCRESKLLYSTPPVLPLRPIQHFPTQYRPLKLANLEALGFAPEVPPAPSAYFPTEPSHPGRTPPTLPRLPTAPRIVTPPILPHMPITSRVFPPPLLPPIIKLPRVPVIASTERIPATPPFPASYNLRPNTMEKLPTVAQPMIVYEPYPQTLPLQSALVLKSTQLATISSKRSGCSEKKITVFNFCIYLGIFILN